LSTIFARMTVEAIKRGAVEKENVPESWINKDVVIFTNLDDFSGSLLSLLTTFRECAFSVVRE
jgi:hypothetical protein